jgi:MoaA/NifB/PqqE/SkfB family radical SAM enzyme
MSDTLCAYPWAGTAVRPDGTILPCCKFIHNKEFGNIINQDPRSSNAWTELRKQMLAGNKIDNCKTCYRDEDSGVESLRQQSLKFYQPIDIDPLPLKQLEVSFDNLCNLACVMCSEEFSTKWQTEKFTHRNLVAIGITAHGFDYTSWDLTKVTHLKIIGGEPMMSQEKFIKLLRQFDLTHLEVAVATNGTILPNSDLKTLLESCKRVSYKVSLDGVGEVNNWIRWPSKFSIIENNINTLEQWWADTNINLQFHTVIGIYNINHLQNLVDFILKKPQWNVTWNWITTPTWQSISVLINKEDLKIQLQELGSKYNLDPNPFYISIDRLYDSPQSDWPTAVKETKRLILERNIMPKSFSAD